MSIRKLVCLTITVGAVTLAATILPPLAVVRAQNPAATGDENKPADDSKPPEDSPLFKDPKTPEELFEAAVLMVEFQRPNLARYYLRRLMNPSPDAATLLALRDKFGAADFLRLSEQRELRPLSIELLDRSNDAALARMRDPQTFEQLTARLVGGGEEQVKAIEEFRSYGSTAVPVLTSLWRKSTEPAARAAARVALRNLGQPALPALTAALDVPDPDWQVNLLRILAEIGSRDAVPYVWFSAVNPDAAAEVRAAASRLIVRLVVPTDDAVELTADSVSGELRRLAREYFLGRQPWEPDLVSGQAVLWNWDAQLDELIQRPVASSEAARLTGLRFARQAVTLTPDDRESQVLYLTLALASESRLGDVSTGDAMALPGGADSIREFADRVGDDVLLDVLRLARQHGRSLTAARTLRLLGDLTTWDKVRPRGEISSPVYDAIGDRDPRVQFEAADAILRLNPPAATSFPGSTRIVSILTRALTTNGTPRVIVGDSNTTHANFVGGLFAELGYEPAVVTSGRDVFRMAAERGDIDLVLLSPNLTRWPLSETVANLHADARTAGLPIVIPVSQLANAELDVSKERLALHARLEKKLKYEKYTSVAFFPEVKTSNVLERLLDEFLARLPAKSLTPRERQARVAIADPSPEHGAFVGRMFNTLGFAPITSTTGAEGRAASDQARVELVVLNAGIMDGTASQTFARLRAEGQAASLPIIVLFQDVPSGDQNAIQRRLAELVLREGDSTLLGEHAVIKLAISLRTIGVQLTPVQISRLREMARFPKESDFHIGLLAATETFEHITTRVEELTPKFDSPSQAVALPKHLRSWLQDSAAGVTVISESQTSSDIARQLRPFLEKLSVRPLTPAERADQSRRAAKWLAHLATNPNARAFDITPAESSLGTALDGDPELAKWAVTALAEIGTKTSQQRMAALVLDARRPIELRRQAAGLLDRHANKHGNLLSKPTIDALRQVWDEVGPP